MDDWIVDPLHEQLDHLKGRYFHEDWVFVPCDKVMKKWNEDDFKCILWAELFFF